MAINITAVTGAAALAAISGDAGYAAIAFLILVVAAARIFSLLRYKSRAAQLSDIGVVRWERLYCVGASAFAIALGMLFFRAL